MKKLSEESKNKNWSLEWMQKAEVLNCAFNRWKELEKGAEPRSEEETLLWIVNKVENNMIGFTLDEVSAMSNGKNCINADICPFYNIDISEDTKNE